MHKPVTDIIVLGILIFLLWAIAAIIRSTLNALFAWYVVYDYQHGVLYDHGRVKKILGAGRYLIFKPWQSLVYVDMRETTISVTNQEIVCSDSLALRFSSALVYKVTDAVKSIEAARNTYEILYLDLQLVLREAVAGMTVEDVLTRRNEISNSLLSAIQPKAEALGLQVTSGGIKDITLPAEVRRIYSQVMQAEKLAQANMAKSRAEVASLRALANAAKMMDGNPNLLHLRTLQALSELTGTTGNTGNTIVFGMPPQFVPPPTGRRPATPPVDSDA